MADLTLAAEHEPDTDLLVSFDNKRPIDAAEIGLLLRELSADYKRTTGGTLALRRFETGSSHLIFTDAIVMVTTAIGVVGDVSGAIEHMKAFAKQLEAVLQPIEKSDPFPSQTGKVMKGATRIAKIAAEYDCVAEVDYHANSKTGTERLRVKLTPAQAQLIQERARLKRMSEVGDSLATHDTPLISPPDVREITQHLIKSTTTQANGIADDVAVLAIVRALKASGASNLLSPIAAALEAHGRFDLAKTVRKHIPTGNNPLRIS